MKNRPRALSGSTYETRCPCGDLYITCNDDEEGKLFEVFITLGKAGGCGSANKAAIGILISVAMRSNVLPLEIVKTIGGIECNRSNLLLPSCVSQIAHTIAEHENRKKETTNE